MLTFSKPKLHLLFILNKQASLHELLYSNCVDSYFSLTIKLFLTLRNNVDEYRTALIENYGNETNNHYDHVFLLYEKAFKATAICTCVSSQRRLMKKERIKNTQIK
jgi:hypothetical protein